MDARELALPCPTALPDDRALVTALTLLAGDAPCTVLLDRHDGAPLGVITPEDVVRAVLPFDHAGASAPLALAGPAAMHWLSAGLGPKKTLDLLPAPAPAPVVVPPGASVAQLLLRTARPGTPPLLVVGQHEGRFRVYGALTARSLLTALAAREPIITSPPLPATPHGTGRGSNG